MLRTRIVPPMEDAGIAPVANRAELLLQRRREDHDNASAAIRCVVAAETYKLTGRLPVWASST